MKLSNGNIAKHMIVFMRQPKLSACFAATITRQIRILKTFKNCWVNMEYNLYLCKIKQTPGGAVNAEWDDDWDPNRSVGLYDKAFAGCSIERIYVVDKKWPQHDAAVYWRPKSLLETRRWIKLNVDDDHQRRLLYAIERMEDEADLYFYDSY